MTVRFGLFTIFLIGAACASTPMPIDLMRAQFTEDWKYWMTQYPEAATIFGYPGQNARWTDYSLSAIDARNEYLRNSLERFSAIDRARLPEEAQVDYDLYRELLETAAKGLEFHNEAMPVRGVVPGNVLMPITQMAGIQQEVPRLLAAMPTATREDYENIVARLQGVGALVDQTIALMERGLAAGMTPPGIAMRDVAAQVEAQIRADARSSPLLSAFTKWPDSIPESDRRLLRERAVQAYQQAARPAFMRLRDFLVGRYVPACRDTTSVAALPKGREMYEYNVRWHTTTGLSPREIHDLGVAEVERIRGEMDAVIAATGFEGGYAEFVKFLRSDPRFYYTDASALLTGYRDICKRADPELAPLFGRLPQTPYGVKPVPVAIAPSQTTAYYDPGSFVVGRPGHMFANTYKLEARPKWEMEALTLHEAVPGHHLQISLAQEMQGLPEFRRNASYTAFVEGWALYAESLGDEMGFYTDPYSKFGQLTYEMWRAVRLVVDTGLHAMGWTRDQAIRFFTEHAAKTPQDIVVEVDRYIVWPGQAIGYKIGQMKIQELRASSLRELGGRFDIRQFHDTILGEGAVPLDVLERRVKAWTALRRATAVE